MGASAQRWDGPATSGSGQTRIGAWAASFRRRRVLDREEEALLVESAARGDRAALAVLFEAHFPLLVKSALAFKGRGLDAEDLVGEACMGLVEALPRFDASRKLRFMTYAL